MKGTRSKIALANWRVFAVTTFRHDAQSGSQMRPVPNRDSKCMDALLREQAPRLVISTFHNLYKTNAFVRNEGILEHLCSQEVKSYVVSSQLPNRPPETQPALEMQQKLVGHRIKSCRIESSPIICLFIRSSQPQIVNGFQN